MKNKLSIVQSLKAGLFAAIAAAVVNAVLFLICHATGIFTDDIFVQPGQPLILALVIMSSVFPALIGSLVFFAIDKFTNNGWGIFRILSIVLVLLSLVSPFTNIKNVPMPFAIALDVMHLVVAGSVLFFIGRAVKDNN